MVTESELGYFRPVCRLEDGLRALLMSDSSSSCFSLMLLIVAVYGAQQILGLCRKVKGFHGVWTFFKDADAIPSSSFDCIRAYNRSGESPSSLLSCRRQYRSSSMGSSSCITPMLQYSAASGDGTRIHFYSWYKTEPASGRATQRKDGNWEHSYERNMSDAYFGVCLPCMSMPIATMRPLRW